MRQFHRGFASRAFHCLFQRMSKSIERFGGSDVWFSSSWVDGTCPEREIWEPDIDLPESSYLPFEDIHSLICPRFRYRFSAHWTDNIITVKMSDLNIIFSDMVCITITAVHIFDMSAVRSHETIHRPGKGHEVRTFYLPSSMAEGIYRRRSHCLLPDPPLSRKFFEFAVN